MKASKLSFLSRRKYCTLYFFPFYLFLNWTKPLMKYVSHNKTKSIQWVKQRSVKQIKLPNTYLLYIQITLLLWFEILESIMGEKTENVFMDKNNSMEDAGKEASLPALNTVWHLLWQNPTKYLYLYPLLKSEIFKVVIF